MKHCASCGCSWLYEGGTLLDARAARCPRQQIILGRIKARNLDCLPARPPPCCRLIGFCTAGGPPGARDMQPLDWNWSRRPGGRGSFLYSFMQRIAYGLPVAMASSFLRLCPTERSKGHILYCTVQTLCRERERVKFKY